MEEFKKQIIFIFVFVIVLSGFVAFKTVKNLYFNSSSGVCIKVSDKLCLSADFGVATDYYEASSLCSKKGMRLPTLNDAWDIWISSENCKRAFSSNEEIPRNRESFISTELEEYPYVMANSINNYCNDISQIKFPIASQYKGGMYWLKDTAGNDKHYTINYNRAVINAKDNRTKGIGIRCVYPLVHNMSTP